MIPKQVEEAAQMAEELHGSMMNNADPPEETEEQPEEQEAATSETSEPEEDWYAKYQKLEQKHKTLEGKYNAEVPRFAERLKHFEELNNVLLQKTTPKEIAPPSPKEERLKALKEEYGEELFEMAKLVAEMEIETRLPQTLQPVQQQLASVEETQIAAAQQNFVGYLDEAVKDTEGNPRDWRKLWSGEDTKFQEFLQKVEPNSGFSYMDIVKHHNANWNADGLAAVFKTYYDQQKPITQATPKKNPAKDAMVAPSRSSQPAPPAVDDKRIWTQDTIAAFQREDRAGKYDAETSQKMWNDLLSALKEGRIR